MQNPVPQLPNASRAAWLKQLHRWHWISSALCLFGMLLFAITGITLNHAGQIEASPSTVTRKATLPAPLQREVAQFAAAHVDERAPLPARVVRWTNEQFKLDVAAMDAEWSEEDAYISLPRPGGDAWLRIGADGVAEYEKTSRGAVSYLNDLHKGRHTGVIWSWFLDIFALACIVFCLTGFLILKMHATNRRSTWPVIGFGILLPLLLALLFIH